MRWPLNVPVLHDGVVTLRAHTPLDLDAMLEMATDPTMIAWTGIQVPHTRDMSEQFAFAVIPRGWEDGSHRGWAIEATDDDGRSRFAGNVDIRQMPIADIGYALHPWARGRGLMARAVRLALDWALTEGGVEIVHWRAHVGNEASLRVAHATGFTLHGLTPGILHERGQVIDAWTGSYRFGDSPYPTARWAGDGVIEGDDLRLRPLAESDVPRIVEACSDPTTRHFLAHLPDPYTAVSGRAYVHDSWWRAATGATATWAIASRDTDELIGTVAVMDLLGTSHDTGEIGYWVHPDARGRGVATAATRLVVRHAFDPEGLNRRRLTLYAAATNPRSNAVAVGSGFSTYGTQRLGERVGDGSCVDLIGYELLR